MKKHNISILYVEDEENVRAMLTRFLNRYTDTLYVAKDGKEGLELYTKHQPDIIISDIKMPRMSGLEMLEQIKQNNPDQLALMLTAHSDGELLIDAINIGIDGYILKPIDLDTVDKKLLSLIDLLENKYALEALKESEEQFRTITQISLNGIFIYQKTFVYVNEAMCNITGYSAEELYTIAPWELVTDDMKEQLNQIVMLRLSGEKVEAKERVLTIKTKSGDIRSVKLSAATMPYKGGYAGTGNITDITDVLRIQSRLKLLSQVAEQTNDMVLITDIDANIVYVNESLQHHSQYSEEELLGNNCRIFKSGKHPKEFYEKMWKTILRGDVYSGILINRKKDGSLYYDEKIITPLKNDNGEIRYFVSTSRDITERITLEEELKRLATKDALTGIYNRYKINLKIEEEFKRAKRYNTPFALIMFDIDHFKDVNDTYGHDVGDSVLRELSREVQKSLRTTDVFGRWGGEEFMILIPHATPQNIHPLAEKIRKSVEEHHFEKVGSVTVSLGVTCFRDTDTLPELLKRVDDALYTSKQNGRNRVTVA